MGFSVFNMQRCALPVILAVFALCAATMAQADISRFTGSYVGSADVISADGKRIPRDMNVEINQTKNGFQVSWTSTTHRADGTLKSKSYTIDFEPAEREGVYAAAMKKNVFGHNVQLDPMKGEPFVWSRIEADTLSVYSLFVTENGGYEIQQFDRTLADGGLELEFQVVLNGEILRAVSTFLTKQ